MAQPSRTDRVRCLHCKRAQTIHTRRGYRFKCRFCGEMNPGPALSEAVIAPWGATRRKATPAGAPSGEASQVEVPAGAPPAGAAAATTPVQRARPVRRSVEGAANRPSTERGRQPPDGQPAAPPPTVSKKQASLFDRLVFGG